MNQNFEFNIKNIKNISLAEKKSRENDLKLFREKGFPNKNLEEWKFTDLNKIINDNFEELKLNNDNKNEHIELIKDFEHNSIVLINGFLKSKNFKYENEKKIKISDYKCDQKKNNDESNNSLINLNNALFEGGYFLEVSSDYKFNKPIIVYNYFLNNLKNTIVNNKNLIILNENSDLNMIEFNSDISKNNFIHNNCTDITISKNASLTNYAIQGSKSNCFYYKFVKCNLNKKSKYEDYIFLSGLKFSRTEEDINIAGEEANCVIQSALYLDSESHQEVKTKLNHLKPNCKSYQKIKNVLNKKSKGAYQGKIFVKNIAQKTDAYQLSKALLLDDSSEFNAKPELEIYADDVKCSHGSTSGSINEDSIYYLMTRGIPRKNAIELLTKAFLFEIANSISNKEIKIFVEKNLDKQIYGY